MKGPPGPPTARSVRSADDSVETTTPDPDPRKSPRAPPPSVHALRLLDDEPTRVGGGASQPTSPSAPRPGEDLFSRDHEGPPLPPPRVIDPTVHDPDATINPDATSEPLTLPIGALTSPAAPRVIALAAPVAKAPPTPMFTAPIATASTVASPPPPVAVAAPPIAAPLPSVAVPLPSITAPTLTVASQQAQPAIAAPAAAFTPATTPSHLHQVESIESVVVESIEVLPSPAPAPLAPAPLAPLAFATPEDEPAEASVFAQVALLPCSIRALIVGLRASPDPRGVQEVAVRLLECVRALHDGGAVLGEQLAPEHFYCRADRRVEFRPAAPPPVEVLDLYRAPELFKGRGPTVQSDIFAAAAIVYELFVGRSLKPMFLPQVMQAGRTDTWFADPGRSMHEAYKPVLRIALSDRATQRHANLGVFVEEFTRAWRLANNPVARLADPEKQDPSWKKAVLPAVIVTLFVLVVIGLLAFPVERIDQPDVPTVRPELSQ